MTKMNIFKVITGVASVAVSVFELTGILKDTGILKVKA